MNYQDWFTLDYRKRNNVPFVDKYPHLRTVYHEESDSSTFQLVEMKPQKRQVHFRDYNFSEGIYHKHSVLLPFPYMYFGIRKLAYLDYFQQVKFGISNKPINNLDDLIYMPPLANIYSSFAVCLGDTFRSYDPIKDLFQTRFHSNDYNPEVWCGCWVFDNVIKSLSRWETLDPLSVDWPIHTTVKNFIAAKPYPPSTHLVLDSKERNQLDRSIFYYQWARPE